MLSARSISFDQIWNQGTTVSCRKTSKIPWISHGLKIHQNGDLPWDMMNGYWWELDFWMVFHQPKMIQDGCHWCHHHVEKPKKSARNRQGIPTVQAEQILPAFTPDDTISLGRVDTNGSNLADFAGAVFRWTSMWSHVQWGVQSDMMFPNGMKILINELQHQSLHFFRVVFVNRVLA